jgi:ElaB/YqjD/DUF883 family membrane-anchored ribosome-binding protein
MNAILDDTGPVNTYNGKVAKSRTGSTAQTRRAGESQEVHDLVADVEDLLGQMAHVADPEVERLRAKVAATLTTAKRAITDGREQLQRRAQDAMKAGDGYVQHQPWQAVGIAAAVGVIVGFLVAKR